MLPPPVRRSSRLALPLLFALSALLPAVGAPAQTPEEPTQLGGWAVGFRAFELVDANRDGRSLATALWYPVLPSEAEGDPAFYDFGVFGFGSDSEVAIAGAPAAAPAAGFPLVVFSHGSGGINTQSTTLMEALASHGFVVVSPNHTGNTAVDAFFTSLVPFSQSVVDRPLDVSFVIDVMLASNASPDDPLFGRIDPTRIGVAGHSFGGYTALAMAAGGQDTPADPRVRAIASIAPAAEIFSPGQLAPIGIPVMILGGTLDTTTPIVPNSTRPFEEMISRRVYRADITGATHTGFANVCQIGEVLRSIGSPDSFIASTVSGWTETCAPDAPLPIGEVQRLQNLYLVSFFRRHLRGEAEYDAFLEPAYTAANEPAVTYFSKTSGCGAGFEIALLLPAVVLVRRLRRDPASG
jgi:predicted dienelactone hydrolase